MKLSIYSVFDSKAQAYIPPFFLQNDAVAVRAFTFSANNPEHDFGRFPVDYTLFKLGEFDDSTGEVVNLSPALNLGLAAIFKE
jgi:hypothetical protein